MKVLLIIPRYCSKYGEYYDFPLGFGYISAALKIAGYDVHCLNLNNHQEPVENLVIKEVRKLQPNAIATGGLSVHYKHIKQVIGLTRIVSPNSTIIVGGGIISSEPELMLRALQADIGVIGEGDETIVKLMNCIKNESDLSIVNGIIFKSKESGEEKIVINPKATPIKDLDSLPFVDYEGLGMKEHLNFQRFTDRIWFNNINSSRIVRGVEMIGSRSCPFDCSFCFHPLGRVYRERSLNNFFIEVEHLIETYNINSLMLLDELFAANAERLIEFCNRIKRYNLKWTVQLRVDLVNEDVLDLMKNSGCVSISYGIESMSSKVLIGMKKHTKPLIIEQALDLTYKKCIDIQGNLIFGDSSETIFTAKETIDWWKHNRKYKLYLDSIQQYPGTKIYYDAINKGVLIDKLSFIERGCPTVNTTAMDDAMFNNIMSWIRFLNAVMILPAKLISFKKISIFDKLRGELYDIECICPHCGEYNKFSSLCMSEYLCGLKVPRLSCCVCNHRFDIPRIIPEIEQDEYVKLLFDIAVENLVLNPEHSVKVLNEILKTDNKYSKAYYLLGEIYYMNKNYTDAYLYFANAMINNPTVPFYFKVFGDLLIQFGRNDDAEIFFEQEKMLSSSLSNFPCK